MRWDTRALRARAAGALAGVAVLATGAGAGPGPAEAVLVSPNAQVPRSVPAALRRAVPAVDPDSKRVQDSLENVAYLLRIPQRKPWKDMRASVGAALAEVRERPERLLDTVPPEQQAAVRERLGGMAKGLDRAILCIDGQDADKLSFALASVLDDLAAIEVAQAPGLPYLLPNRVRAFPHLDGRAKVELRVEQGGGKAGLYTKAGGGTSGQGNLTITLDGFSSPVSAGTFARRVLDGAFDGVTLQSSPYALSVTPPAAEGRAQEELPLEMLPYGEFEPIYGQALNIQDGEYPVLPMSVYGAVAMAHSPTNAYASSSDAFFIYKFDRQNMGGLGGLSFDEGQFTVVGYVTDGAELLAQLDSGDKLVSSRLVEGRDKLKGLPEPAPAPAPAVPEAAVPEVVPVAEAAAQ